jgi:hypothetical protein
MFAILEYLNLRAENLWRRGQFPCHVSPTKFHKTHHQLVQSCFFFFCGGQKHIHTYGLTDTNTHTHTHTHIQKHRQGSNLISLHFSFRKECRLIIKGHIFWKVYSDGVYIISKCIICLCGNIVHYNSLPHCTNTELSLLYFVECLQHPT